MDWKDVAKLYAPYIAYSLCVILGAIYTFGYRQGMQNILIASAQAGKEAKCGN